MQSTKSKKNNKKSTLFVLTVFLILVIITSILVINETKITPEKIISKSFNALKEVDIDTFNRYNVSNITRNIEEKLNIDEDTISKDVYKDLLKACFSELQKKMLEIKSDQKEYSAATLIEANEKLQVAKNVDCFYKEIIAQCEINNKCGNRLVYLNSYNSLKRFTNGKLEIPFNTINVAWLEKYEKWLRSNGNKETTISLMFRTLRSTYNKAIKERCAHLSDYPFQEYKISKFDTSTQKRAIAKTDMLKFTETSQPIGQKKYVELSKDIFIFSYLCGGINFTDIANLTQENIVNGRLHYIRQKTGKLIKIGIPQEAMQIIKKYTDESNGYLFPILNVKVHKTALQKQNRIHKIRGKVNDILKTLGKRLGIEANITTYVAKHHTISI